MKTLLLALLLLTACATKPALPPVLVQCFVKQGPILMKTGETRLYAQDKIIAVSMKDVDTCILVKLPKGLEQTLKGR